MQRKQPSLIAVDVDGFQIVNYGCHKLHGQCESLLTSTSLNEKDTFTERSLFLIFTDVAPANQDDMTF